MHSTNWWSPSWQYFCTSGKVTLLFWFVTVFAIPLHKPPWPPCTIMGTSVSWASACSNMLVCEVLTTFNDHDDDDDNDYDFDDGDEMV